MTVDHTGLDPRRPRPFFVVGCPRSGTTLLRDLLRSHPRLAIPTESHFIPGFYRAFGNPVSDAAAWQIARRILSTPRVSYWEVQAKPSDFAGCRSFAEVTRRLYETWAAAEGKPRWGDKTPHYVRDIPLLMRLFPDAQVIHIIRDGRDAALSWLRVRFEPKNLYMAARLWKEMVRKGRGDGAALAADSYLELRYETLISEPETTMRSVCRFLGEPFDPAVLKPAPSYPWVGYGKLAVPMMGTTSHGIRSDNGGRWRERMSLNDRSLFESVAGDLLSELGYPVEGLQEPLSRPQEILYVAQHRLRQTAAILRRLRRSGFRRNAAVLTGNSVRRLTRRLTAAFR